MSIRIPDKHSRSYSSFPFRNPLDSYMGRQMEGVKADAMPPLTESNDEQDEEREAARPARATVDIGRLSPTRAMGEG